MRSNAGTVDAYLNQASENRHDWLIGIRADGQDLLAGFEELMAYGMPGYIAGIHIRGPRC